MSLALAVLVRIASLFGLNLSQFAAGALIAGTAAAALSTGALVWHHKIYQSGYDQALANIAEENVATIARAVAKRNVWRDCRARNGQWDQSTGTCS